MTSEASSPDRPEMDLLESPLLYGRGSPPEETPSPSGSSRPVEWGTANTLYLVRSGRYDTNRNPRRELKHPAHR